MRCVLGIFLLGVCVLHASAQSRRVGKFSEVYAWKQITYDINSNILTQDRATSDGLNGHRNPFGRMKRQSYYRSNDDSIYFNDNPEEENHWNQRNPVDRFNQSSSSLNLNSHNNRPTTTNSSKLDERSDHFFIQYNNVPMGAERVGDRLFIALPRRRYGIPATLNTVDLRDRSRSPHLKPYPSLRAARNLVSVYRTRADRCGRLWAVDTGLMELPGSSDTTNMIFDVFTLKETRCRYYTNLVKLSSDTPRQIQQPAIVVFNLRTDRQILRYELKSSDLPANNTPTGLASITVDTSAGCADAFAYIPDLTTFGIVVYSLRENDSWRVTHSYMHFNPAAVNLHISGQRFQWSDGIFSIALAPGSGCRTAFFHPLISTQEFAVNTCTLNNRTASSDPNYWTKYAIVGERGNNTQSTMHDIHHSGVLFYADIGGDGVACWNTHRALQQEAFQLLASDVDRMSYPADLHVTDDEVWVITNTLPRFGYTRLDPNQYNFYIYKANVQDLVAGTVCAPSSNYPRETPIEFLPVPTSNNNFPSNVPLPTNNYQSSTYNKYN